jgi:phospholipid/cholesterol/gamma-HCH transport system substrate-binding protein
MVRTLKDELERVAAAFEDSQLIPKMADLVDRADRVMDGVEQGKGTVGRLLADDSLFEQAVEMTAALQSAGERLGAAGDRVSRLVDEASTGNGMIARLLQDDSLYDRALGLIKDLESGQGTLGQLIQNPEVYDEIRAAAGNLSAFSERLNDPDSSVSRLLSDNGRLYSRIEGALGALDEIGKEAKEGDGTIGRLLRDPALYEEARQTLDGVRKAVEDFREQAPISTFGSLFFGAL